MADWQAKREDAPRNVTVGQLTLQHLRHCEGHYVKDGQPTSQQHVIRSALRRLNTLYRETRAEDFSPKMLKAVRDAMVAEGMSRPTVNQYASILRQAFKRGVSEELLPATVLLGLQTVRDLQAGRSAAREPDSVRPVLDSRLDAICKHGPGVVWATIQLQRLTGMRPGEVLIVRGCDLSTSRETWEIAGCSQVAARRDQPRGHDRPCGPGGAAAVPPNRNGRVPIHRRRRRGSPLPAGLLRERHQTRV